ncbi:glycosyltransferase family 2 protein [Candidatus Uhrbacteria bacterium]|nr:glycosyltransferase family 2 protein [Candidatus Uhrbacteria bacterium]
MEVTSRYPKEHVDIAIVTVSANRLDEACLTSVRTLIEATPLSVTFILVDNASTAIDAHALTKKIFPEAIVILRDKNVGFGRSCNRGAKEVDADYYFFLNPDTRVDDPEVLLKLYRFLKSCPRVGIAAPKILYMDGRLQETCRRFPSWFTPIAQRTSLIKKEKTDEHRRAFLMEDFAHHKRRMVDWVQGSAFMIEAKLFHEIGGFDDRYFMYYEDVDLCRTCWELGRPVYYLPEAILYHAYGKASAKGESTMEKILHNRTTRIHIGSWLKYTLKWMGQKI